MNKKRIIALVLALCTAAMPFGALAENDDHKTVNSQLLQYKNEGNWGKIKQLINKDYRDIIEDTDEITINVNELETLCDIFGCQLSDLIERKK